MTTTLTLNILPKPKLRPRFDRRGIARTPQSTRDYENAVRVMLRDQWKKEPLKTAIRARITFFVGCPKTRPSRKSASHIHPCVRPDWDNLAKALCDSANGILWNDDGQLVDVHVQKKYDWAQRKVGVVLEFEELDGSEQT